MLFIDLGENMGVVETLLLLAGSVAAIGAVGLVAYRGFSSKKMVVGPNEEMSAVVTNTSTIQPVEEASTIPKVQMESIPFVAQAPAIQAEHVVSSSPEPSPIPLATAPAVPVVETVPEAPAPFAEDFAPKTSVPTDVGAVSNFAGPTETAIAPVLVIQAPKLKRTRTTRRRLPTSASTPGAPASAESAASALTAPRRRRTSRAKTVATPSSVPTPEPMASPSSGMNSDQPQ